MDDEWVVGWTALESVDFGGCGWIESVGSESVDRLGGERHEPGCMKVRCGDPEMLLRRR